MASGIFRDVREVKRGLGKWMGWVVSFPKRRRATGFPPRSLKESEALARANFLRCWKRVLIGLAPNAGMPRNVAAAAGSMLTMSINSILRQNRFRIIWSELAALIILR